MKKYEQLTWKYLKQNKKRTFSTMFGVAFGALLLFAIVNVVFCLIEKSLRNAESIFKFDAIFYNLSEEQATAIENYPGVETIYDGAMHPYTVYDIGLVMVDDFENNPYGICLEKGEYPKDSHEVILNRTIEQEYEIGDTVSIYPNPWSYISEPMEFVVVGMFVYDGDFGALSMGGLSYISMLGLLDEHAAQQMQDKNAVFVKYRNPYRIRRLSEQISKTTGAEYVINDSISLYYNQSSDGSLQSIYVAIVLSAVILLSWMMVAVIRNTLRISVAERIRDYGVLRCAGTSLKQIKKMLLQESLLIGIISGTAGPVIAYVGLLIFSANSKRFDFSHFYLLAYIFALLVVLVNMMLATIGPYNMLAKMTPIEAVRNQVKTSVKKTYKVRKAKLITKIFGIEGAYAYKNAMRNPKQFVTTVLALVLGLILFICTETLYETALKYYIPDNLLNYYNVVAGPLYDEEISNLYHGEGDEDVYKDFERNMNFAEAELAMLDDAGKTLDEIIIADGDHYIEAYSLGPNDECLAYVEEKRQSFYQYLMSIPYPEDDSDVEAMLDYARFCNLRTKTIIGLESEMLSAYRNVLIEGTCDPAELGEDGIILFNSGMEKLSLGDQVTFVTAPYEEIERRMWEKVNSDIALEAREILRSYNGNVKPYIFECLLRFEVFQDLYREGYYRTYTIKGIISSNSLFVTDEYDTYPRYIMTKEQVQELLPGHERIIRLAMHADGYDQDIINILEKYELYSNYQMYMSEYKLFEHIRGFFDFVLAVVLMFMTINIFNTTSTNMIYRKREFALLRCVGISKKKLMYMIMLEGLLAVMIATVIGLVLGIAGCYGIYRYCAVFIEDLTVVYISPSRLISAVVLLFAILFLASWIPLQSIKKEIAPELAQTDE